MTQSFDFHSSIKLSFADHSAPGTPLPLSQDNLKKLAQIPRLQSGFAKRYPSKLGDPILWGGAIYIPIADGNDLYGVAKDITSDLIQTATEIKVNATLASPLPLTQAVTHPACVEVLYSLALTHAQSNLTASIEIDGVDYPLPTIPLAAFTSPSESNTPSRAVKMSVDGVCRSTGEATRLLIDDGTHLLLPSHDYDVDAIKLLRSLLEGDVLFVGTIEEERKGIWRALPDGRIIHQNRINI